MNVFVHNPVLGKEIHTRLNLRRQSGANKVAVYAIAGAALPLLYFFCIRALVTSRSLAEARDFYVIWTMGVEMSLLLLMAPALAAGAITIEREKQTWNALLLSRLSRSQIVVGKYLGALAPVGLALALFVPINLLAAGVGKIPPGTLLLSHAILLLTGLLCGAIGLFCSWACRRTQIATSAAMGTVAMLVLGSYLSLMLWQMAVGHYESVRETEFVPLWLNPYFALWATLDTNSSEPYRQAYPMAYTTYATFAVGLSALLLTIVTRRLAGGPKEMSA